MLALTWRYRWGCTAVFVLQIIVVASGLAGLGLTGVGIDFIGQELRSPVTPRHLPAAFGFSHDCASTDVLELIARCILLVAMLTATLRYAAAIAFAALSQRVLVQLRSDVYDKVHRLSLRFFDRHR